MPLPHTPEHAVQNFHGGYDVIHARQIQTRRCSRSCLDFWFIGLCMIALILISVAMIAIYGIDSSGGRFWQTLLSFSIGVIVPNPKYKKEDVTQPNPGAV